MPDTPLLPGFLGASLILTIAPGPDNLMVLAHSLARGWRAGLGFAAGCTLGCMTHILWATLGVSAALMASPMALTLLKWLGAGYLVWMAFSTWRINPWPGATPPHSPGRGWQRDVLRGFLANAINPKVALFFLAFMPQFLSPVRGPASSQMLLLGAVFMAQTLLVFGAIALLSGTIGDWMKRYPKVAPWLHRLSGLVFIALAANLILSSAVT